MPHFFAPPVADALEASPALASDALLIGGGVEHRRSIVHYDASDQVATLDEPLHSVSAEAEWRIQAPLRDAAGSPDGENFTYIWDSSEVPDSAGVELRVVVQDADPGIPGTSTTSKSYRSDFEMAASLRSPTKVLSCFVLSIGGF